MVILRAKAFHSNNVLEEVLKLAWSEFDRLVKENPVIRIQDFDGKHSEPEFSFNMCLEDGDKTTDPNVGMGAKDRRFGLLL